MISAPQHNKLTKTKGKMVKPILKKLSHSEKNSLDLDRPWEEQQGPGLGGWGAGYESTGPGRSVRDVSFAISDSSTLPGKTRFQHGRSPSGTSHVSVATSASSGGPRSGVFVHPFQPTPRTDTPPLSYANSQVSLDNSNTFNNTASSSIRDYSPTITENEDDDDHPGSLPNHRNHHNHAASASQSNLRRPSFVSQRAASFTDITASAPLRINTGRSVPSGPSLRRNFGGSSLVSSLSHSDLHLSSTIGVSSAFDSPTSIGPTMSSSFASTSNYGLAASAAAPMSPIRNSLDSVGFPRLRSRSEIDAGARTDQIREARRKFEERERAKAQKHDQVMLRKRERKDHKEAKEMERQAAAQLRKSSGSDGKRPSLSLLTTPTFNGSSGAEDHRRNGHESDKYGRRPAELSEKPLAFKSSNYDNMTGGTTPSFGPTVDSVAFKNARRNNSAKRKTQGHWTGFILWLRTRLFRLGRK